MIRAKKAFFADGSAWSGTDGGNLRFAEYFPDFCGERP